jgi:hypothetical protein
MDELIITCHGTNDQKIKQAFDKSAETGPKIKWDLRFQNIVSTIEYVLV